MAEEQKRQESDRYLKADLDAVSLDKLKIRTNVFPSVSDIDAGLQTRHERTRRFLQTHRKLWVLVADYVQRQRKAPPPNRQALGKLLKELVAVTEGAAEGAGEHGRYADIEDIIFEVYTQIVTRPFLGFDNELQPRIRKTDIGACTQEVLSTITVHRASLLFTQSRTQLLYDTLRRAHLKAHVFPLSNVRRGRVTREWMASWFTAANTKCMSMNCDYTSSKLTKRERALLHSILRSPANDGTDDCVRAITAWLQTVVARAHQNFVALLSAYCLDDAHDGANALVQKYKYVGMQFVLGRNDIVDGHDHSLAALYRNVCYRVMEAPFPFSQRADELNFADGFSAPLYYQYEQRQRQRQRRANADADADAPATGTERRSRWAAIGGRRFWKHYAALQREARRKQQAGASRKFLIRTALEDGAGAGAGAGTGAAASSDRELKQMKLYIELLGLAHEDFRLGRVVFTAAFANISAYNMGMLRTLFANRSSDVGDDDGSTVQLSELLTYNDTTHLLSYVANSDFRARPQERRRRRPILNDGRAGAAVQCAASANADGDRGALNDMDGAGFTHAVAAQHCAARSRTTTPLWDSDPPTVTKGNKLRLYLRATMSEFSRRSYAVVNKPYVRCTDTFRGAEQQYSEEASEVTDEQQLLQNVGMFQPPQKLTRNERFAHLACLRTSVRRADNGQRGVHHDDDDYAGPDDDRSVPGSGSESDSSDPGSGGGGAAAGVDGAVAGGAAAGVGDGADTDADDESEENDEVVDAFQQFLAEAAAKRYLGVRETVDKKLLKALKRSPATRSLSEKLKRLTRSKTKQPKRGGKKRRRVRWRDDGDDLT
jgi:hypothetical protein